MNELPPNLKDALAGVTTAALFVQLEHGPGLIVKAPARDLERFRGAPVLYRWELGRFDGGPVLCLGLAFLDNPTRPMEAEAFLNVADVDDLCLAYGLGEVAHLDFHFFDERLEYTYSKRIAHRSPQRVELADLIQAALEWLPGRDLDWAAARAEFERRVARGAVTGVRRWKEKRAWPRTGFHYHLSRGQVPLGALCVAKSRVDKEQFYTSCLATSNAWRFRPGQGRLCWS